MNTTTILAAVAAVLSLAACGGGSDMQDEPGASNGVPLQCVARDADPVRAAQLERECTERIERERP